MSRHCVPPKGRNTMPADYLTSALERDAVTVDLTDREPDFHAVSPTKEDRAAGCRRQPVPAL